MTRSWLVRAGSHGERESTALDHGLIVVGWDEVPDMSIATTREELHNLLRHTYPDSSEKRLVNHLSQLWAFRHTIATGDLVALPRKTVPAIAIGRITGPYVHRADLGPGAQHTRTVDWLITDLPRTAVGQDLLYSLGAFLTVCEIKRNNATARLAALAAGRPDPGGLPTSQAASISEEPSDEFGGEVDLGRAAADQINEFIGRKFAGHGLARLVEAVFLARGMVTWRAPEGPDGGVDVLVGSGPVGMDSPRLCVQVKSSHGPTDVNVIRELQGVVGRLSADQGLLVAWGGLTKAAEREIRSQFFQVRVWTADDLVRELTTHYDRLPEDIQAELPLKRTWVLAEEPNA